MQPCYPQFCIMHINPDTNRYGKHMQLHLFSELVFSANTLQPKRCHSVQSLAQRKTICVTQCHLLLMASGSSLSVSAHVSAKASFAPARWRGGQEEEVRTTEGCSVATGHGCPTTSPTAWHRENAFGNTIPVPTGIRTGSLVREIRAIPSLCFRRCFQNSD